MSFKISLIFLWILSIPKSHTDFYPTPLPSKHNEISNNYWLLNSQLKRFFRHASIPLAAIKIVIISLFLIKISNVDFIL